MSSKKEIIEQINASFDRNDMESFLSFCTDDISWTMVGSSPLIGKQAILDFMKKMGGNETPEMTVDKIIVDGDTGVGTGTMRMKNKEGKFVESAFCDIYDFVGEKVKAMTSYVIDFKK